MNATPDALPMMAVLACFAEGTTTLCNVAHARIKETDRIATMRAELTKLGARVTELPDGLKIDGGKLTGTSVNGHHDHRIAMALAIAGCSIDGTTTVATAESATITFPTFAPCLRGLEADIAALEYPTVTGMNAILIGMKHCGKSSDGKALAAAWNCPFVDTDALLKARYARTHGQSLSVRDIFAKHGEPFFRDLEVAVEWSMAKSGFRWRANCNWAMTSSRSSSSTFVAD